MPNKRKASDSNQSSYKKVIVSSLEEMSNIVSRCASSVLTSYLQKHPISCAALPLAIVFNQRLKAVQLADEKNKARKTTVDESNQDGFVFNLPDPVKNFTGRESELNKIHKSLIDASKALGRSYCIAAITQSMASLNLDKTNNIFSVNGLGGIGKTQLALKYAQLYAKDYDNNVIWVDGENPSDFFKRLAGNSRINIKTKDINGRDKKDNDIAREIYDHFKDKKSLFIFDNVENYEAIKEFLPRQSLDNKPHILITSRYQNWKDTVGKILLNVFSDEEARNFVKKELDIVTIEDVDELLNTTNMSKDFQLILKKDDIQKAIEEFKRKTNTPDKELEKFEESLLQDEEQYSILAPEELEKALKDLLQFLKEDPNITNNDTIEKLNQTLQGLPLALQQATAYIKQQKIVNPYFGVKDYLEEYNRSYKATEDLLSFNLNEYNNDPYVKTVMTTWQVTLDKIKKDEKSGNEASKILNTMAYLAPDNIPSKMLRLVTDKENLAGAIDLLRDYSMISKGDKSDLSNIHRLVQEVIRIGLRKQEAEEEVLKNVLKILKDKIKCIKPKSKSSMINHALLTCVRSIGYSQLHKAIENLFLDKENKYLDIKEEPIKSFLQCIIDQKRVGAMQYILENMEDQWKQEERQLLVQFLLKGFEDNEKGVVNSFKGELQNLMSDPSIFKLFVNASISNNSSYSCKLANRIENRAPINTKLEETIVIEQDFFNYKINLTIEKDTLLRQVGEFLHVLYINNFHYLQQYSSQTPLYFRLSPKNNTSRKPYSSVDDDIKYIDARKSIEDSNPHQRMRSFDNRSSSGELSLGLRQPMPFVDNDYHNLYPRVTPTNPPVSYFQGANYIQDSGGSHHVIGNFFSYDNPIFMSHHHHRSNLIYFQGKNLVTHIQTSVGSRNGMHFVNNHFCNSGIKIPSLDSRNAPILKCAGPIQELENNLREAYDQSVYSSYPRSTSEAPLDLCKSKSTVNVQNQLDEVSSNPQTYLSDAFTQSHLTQDMASTNSDLKKLPNSTLEYQRFPKKKDDTSDTKSLFGIGSSDSKDSDLDWEMVGSYEAQSAELRQPPTFEYYGPIEELENNLSEAMDDCFYSSNPNSMLGDLSVTTLHNSKSYSK